MNEYGDKLKRLQQAYGNSYPFAQAGQLDLVFDDLIDLEHDLAIVGPLLTEIVGGSVHPTEIMTQLIKIEARGWHLRKHLLRLERFLESVDNSDEESE